MINFFDLLVLILAIWFTVSGFATGLLRGIIKLVGFILTLVLFSFAAVRVLDMTRDYGTLVPLISVLVLFLVCIIIGIIGSARIADLVYAIVHKTPVGFIDSGFGCALGLLKALLIGGIIALLLSMAPESTFLGRQYATAHTSRPLVGFISETMPIFRSAVSGMFSLIRNRREAPTENMEQTI